MAHTCATVPITCSVREAEISLQRKRMRKNLVIYRFIDQLLFSRQMQRWWS